MSIVSVAALIGVSQLGTLFTDGFNRDTSTAIVAGRPRLRPAGADLRPASSSLAARLLTPWQRVRRPAHDRRDPRPGSTSAPRRLVRPDGMPRAGGRAPRIPAPRAARAAAIALPLGLWVGHTGRGSVAIVGSANALRAVPSLGPAGRRRLLAGLRGCGDLALTVPSIIVLVAARHPAVLPARTPGSRASTRPPGTPPRAWA